MYLYLFWRTLELALKTWAEGEEARQIEALVREIAARPASQSYQEALELSERVQAQPEMATLEVGRFVDEHRHLCNYDDIFKVPKDVPGE